MYGINRGYRYLSYSAVAPAWGNEQLLYPFAMQGNYLKLRQLPSLPYAAPVSAGAMNQPQPQIVPTHFSDIYATQYPPPYAGHSHVKNQGFSQNVFKNPLLPSEESVNPYPIQTYGTQPNFHPYPHQHAIKPKHSGGMKSIMNSFKGKDGSVDINKMVSTAGQMVQAISQVSSMVKGLGGMLKV